MRGLELVVDGFFDRQEFLQLGAHPRVEVLANVGLGEIVEGALALAELAQVVAQAADGRQAGFRTLETGRRVGK